MHLSPCLLLTKLECESWLEMMTVAEIDKILADIDKIIAAFDAEIGKGRYNKTRDEYTVPVLPAALYGCYKDKSHLPKAADIPLSVKICGMQRWIIGLTRQHLLAALSDSAGLLAVIDWHISYSYPNPPTLFALVQLDLKVKN